LSTLFYTIQLNDILAYEIYNKGTKINKNELMILVYNYQSILTKERIFLFVNNKNYNTESKNVSTVSELFPSANWLEREISELHGIIFSGKKDIRNLLLQYGDTTSPFKKSSPTIGLKEIYYNSLKDTLIQNPVTLQL